MERNITEEASVQAEAFKAEGNSHLSAEEYKDAIECYTRAIDLDPDNAVYYSNRSAAYLAMGDARGKALKDAEKCIELKPEWWKGYSRKGAAEHALGRYDEARATYNIGLKFDPDNASLLEAAEEAYNAGQEHSKRLREYAKQQEMNQKKQNDEVGDKSQDNTAEKEDEVDENALLAEFMSEVNEIEERANSTQKTTNNEKPKINFGNSEGQLVRLLQEHYEWINLNPFRVLMLDIDATEDEIKQHYRKISTMVHPDKFHHPKAREAFEEVAKAYAILQQPDRRKTCVQIIQNAIEKVEKARRIGMKKKLPSVVNQSVAEQEEEVEKAIVKAFAEIEHRRRNLLAGEAKQNQYDRLKEEKEQQKLVDALKRERSWAEVDRRESRVGNWRDFQKDGKRQKTNEIHGWKEEKRESGTKNQVAGPPVDAYKHAWK